MLPAEAGSWRSFDDGGVTESFLQEAMARTIVRRVR